MKTGLAIVAGLLAGVLVAVGVLAAFVFLGPDPVGLRPTPSPSASVAPPPSASASPSLSSSASPSVAPPPSASASPSPSSPPSPSASGVAPSGSGDVQTGFALPATASNDGRLAGRLRES